MADYEDRHWSSEDGLRLHFRDYFGAEDRPPLLCLPGLTRNARDFANLAAALAQHWRVLCPDLRGRGDSDYARDSTSYAPATYLKDLAGLFAQEGIERCVVIGSSLGGLLAMLLAATEPERIVAAAINDIGPDIDPAGIARIRGYVGQGRSFETWMHAARGLQEAHAKIFPDHDISAWLAMAKRVMTVSSNGRIVFDYDMKIAEQFDAAGTSAGDDLWPAWLALAGNEADRRPLLILRGETSDLLSSEVAARMIAAAPWAELVTVPRVGHAPTLDEPPALAAIERLLGKVARA